MDEFVAPDALKVACESLPNPWARSLSSRSPDDNTKVAIVCAAGDDAVKKGQRRKNLRRDCKRAEAVVAANQPVSRGRTLELGPALAAAKANAFETLN